MAKGVSVRRCLGICLVQWCLAWLLRDTSPAFTGWKVGRPHGQAAMARFSQRQRSEALEEQDIFVAEWAKKQDIFVASQIEAEIIFPLFIPRLDMFLNSPNFSGVAASAAYRQLVKMEREWGIGERDWDSSVLLRLHARVEDLARDDQLGEVLDEILLSIAKLSDPRKIPTRLLSLLVESLPGKVNSMSAQGLSNSLEACARLKDIMPGVLKLVPDISVQILEKAKDMVPSALSTCLWGYARLMDSVLPHDLQTPFQAFAALAVEIPDKAKDMKEADLTKCLWALAQLKDVPLLDVKKLVLAISAHTEDFDFDHNDFYRSPELRANLLWAVAKLKDVTFPILKPERKLESLAWGVACTAGRLSPSELRSCTWAIGQLRQELHQLTLVEDYCDFDLSEWRDRAAEDVAGNESLVADLDQWTKAMWWVDRQPEELRDDAEEALNEVFAGNLKVSTRPTGHRDDTLEYREMSLKESYSYYNLLRVYDPGNRTDFAGTWDTIFFNYLLSFPREVPVGLVLMIVFLCARHGFREDELLTSYKLLLTSVSDYFLHNSFSSLSDFELCSLSWAYQSLAQDDFSDFQKLLTREVTNRGLSPADVERGRHGIFLWRESTVSNSSNHLHVLELAVRSLRAQTR